MKLKSGNRCLCGCGKETNLRTKNDPARGFVKGQPSKYLPGHFARTVDSSLDKNPHWKGGRYINHSGYVMIYMPEHKRSMANGYVREHIVLAEKALGRELPQGSQVHHFGETSDNSKLCICHDQKYHFLLHIRAKALSECGDANKRKCKFCQKYDDTENLHCKELNGKKSGWNIYHMECVRAYDRKRYHARKNK